MSITFKIGNSIINYKSIYTFREINNYKLCNNILVTYNNKKKIIFHSF